MIAHRYYIYKHSNAQSRKGNEAQGFYSSKDILQFSWLNQYPCLIRWKYKKHHINYGNYVITIKFWISLIRYTYLLAYSQFFYCKCALSNTLNVFFNVLFEMKTLIVRAQKMWISCSCIKMSLGYKRHKILFSKIIYFLYSTFIWWSTVLSRAN